MSTSSVTYDPSGSAGGSGGGAGDMNVSSSSGSGGDAVIDGVGNRGLYPSDLPSSIHNSHHTSDNDDTGQCSVRWDQDGCSSSNNVVRKQQKSNNISEQAQVASRLQQIRDYIGQTSSVMERLHAAGTPAGSVPKSSDTTARRNELKIKVERVTKKINRTERTTGCIIGT
ncbi:uncharacterized protein LOC142324737 [Lycorma delicatula]|uniref:uncharacterized protein LOC142324737 n=1 Tax=Lycorma delicatula TaxID=130591 RepID=UPI003F517FB1